MKQLILTLLIAGGLIAAGFAEVAEAKGKRTNQSRAGEVNGTKCFLVPYGGRNGGGWWCSCGSGNCPGSPY